MNLKLHIPGWLRLPGFLIVGFFAAALIPITASAQEAEEVTEEEEEETDIIALSPFVVDESQNIGYLASQSLAGTRISTDLKDIAASVFVFAPELIEDTGMTDIQDAFTYGPNTESRATFTEIGVGFVGRVSNVGSGPWNNPARNQRVRGLSAADISRNFFSSKFPMDMFNIERAELVLGPNSIMFGLGSPAGIFNSTTKKAVMRDSGELTLRYEKYDGIRTVLDMNKVMLDDTLAVRLVGLYKDARFDQQPAWDRDKRFFGTLVYTPFKGKTGTTLRISAEWMKKDHNFPTDTPAIDGYTRWNDHGAEGWDHTKNQVDPVTGEVLRNINGDPKQVEGVEGSLRILGVERGSISEGNTIFIDATKGKPRNAFDPSLGDFMMQTRSGYTFDAGRTPAPNGQVPRWGFVSSQGRWDSGSLTSSFEVEENITDRKVWDWKNFNSAGPWAYSTWNGNTWNVTLEQKFFENLFLEFGYNFEVFENSNSGGAGQSKIHIDPNVYLANGEPNPNFRRPFMRMTPSATKSKNWLDEYRVTATYTLDLEKKSKWFGTHQLIGHYNKLTTKFQSWSYYLRGLDNSPDFNDGSVGLSYDFDKRGIANLQYIGPPTPQGQPPRATHSLAWGVPDSSDTGKVFKFGPFTYFLPYTVQDPSVVRRNPLPDALLPPGLFHFASGSTDHRTGTVGCIRDRANSDYLTNCIQSTDADGNPVFDTLGNPLYEQLGQRAAHRGHLQSGDGGLRQGEWFDDGSFTLGLISANGVKNRNEFESKAFILQSHMLRKGDGDDHLAVVTYGWRRDTVTSYSAPGRILLPGGFHDLSEDGGFRLRDDPVGPPTTEDSITIGVVGHPLKWLRVHYNQSSNFKAQAARISNDGTPFGPETGTGKDYGFSLSMFKGKFQAKINWFKVEQNDVTARNLRFIAFYRIPRIEMEMENNLALHGRLDELVPQPAGYPGRVNNLAGVSNYSAEGNELWFNFNPTRNLRLQFTVSRQATIQSDIAPRMKAYTKERVALFEQTKWWSRKGKEGTGPEGTGMDFKNGAVGWNPSIAETCPVGGLCTIEEFYELITRDPINTQSIKEGRNNQQQAEWRWNAVANYTFDEGFLDGFNFGGALRWVDEAVIGYNIIDGEIDGAPTQVSDLDNPYIGDAEFFADLWFGYRRQIMNGRVNWKAQLNLRNVGQNAELDPIGTHLDGTTALYRIVPETTWFVTNSFRF